MHSSRLLTLLSLLSIPCGACCGNILVYPVDGSHWVNMEVLIMELHSKGHHITVLRMSNSLYIKEESPYYISINIGKSKFDEDFYTDFALRFLKMQKEGEYFWKQYMLEQEVMKTLHEYYCTTTSMLFENQMLMNSFRDSKYDVMLTDPVFGNGVFLAHRLGLPLVFNVRWTIHGEGHFDIAPSPLSYVPVPGAELTDKMSFIQRVKNVLIYIMTLHHQMNYIRQPYKAFCEKYFGPEVDYFSLFQDADIWLMRNDFTFEFPRPTMPNVIYMGGFQCKPSKPLPSDVEEFVQSSGEHGVIIMSLGTFFGQLSSDIDEEIAAAFAQLPQKVIWRYTGPRPANLGNNTLLVKWLPQNDLLGHSKTKVFITHGGTNGIQEAIYHGVPLLGLPLVLDQPDNLSRMKKKGSAVIVDFSKWDKTMFLEALKEVLYNPSYRENMQRLSKLHRDQPIKPLDHAVFWIEYVMRHGGAPHLRTQSFRMYCLAYHSVDVILTLLGTVLVISWLTFMLMRFCCRLMFKKKPNVNS